jgi:arginine deiminase
MKTKILAIIFLLLLVNDVYSQIKVESVGAKAEYDKAKVILMHEPGNELFLGVIHPRAALFEDYFRPSVAAKEHRAYQKLLRKDNIKVYTIREILLDGTVNKANQAIEGRNLDSLRNFARKHFKIDPSLSSLKSIVSEGEYLDSIINKMHPTELVDILIHQPEIILKSTDLNTGYAADYKVNPLMNLYFLRDQIITTSEGIVIGRLNSPQRRRESKIVKFCLEKIGIEPIGDIGDIKKEEGAFLEGGDFFPFGNTVFIGQGMRTTKTAIQYLMDKKLFGAERVIVVKDILHDQSQMHLDTYFNIINKDLCVLETRRLEADERDRMYLKADVYELKNGKYETVSTDKNFVELLKNDLNLKIISASKEDFEEYGINFLTIDAGKIVVVKGVSEKYLEDLQNEGVEVLQIDFTNMKRGWGAAHCTTQVIKRKK